MDRGQQFGLEFHSNYLTLNLGDGFSIYTEYRFLGLAIGVTVLVALAKRIIKNKRGL